MDCECMSRGRGIGSSVVYIHQVGFESCKPGHRFGPAVRDHYLMHCILDGEGVYWVGKRKYRLKKGEGFLIVPGVVTWYQADRENPWRYCWVGFHGTDAENICNLCDISLEYPIFRFSDIKQMENCILKLRENFGVNNKEFRTLSLLYEFFAMLQKKNAIQEKGMQTIDLALDYISKNYSYGITIQQIADHLGISRSHLFRLFKGSTGKSVQEYLLSYRLERAESMMKNTDRSIKEIMYSCGFNDLPNFSRRFRKAYGLPPGAYRREILRMKE
jgi:AraC-like DNA-binding protein